MEELQKINAQALKNRMNRRELFKDGALALAAGALAGAGSYAGLRYLGKSLGKILSDADRQVKELAIDIKVLSGSLERKMAKETRELRDSYTSGKLRVYEELGIATPQELSELERIIKTSEAFEAEYGFVERLNIFRDRITRKLSGIDNASENLQPGFMKRINDSSRKLFGMKTGEEGVKEREAGKERIDSLCRIYDTNEDNRTAETEVLKKINSYLENNSLPEEERELYSFLKQEYQREGKKEYLKEFIRNYGTYSEQNQLLANLINSINESEDIYSRIQENKKYISSLQGLLQEGIELKTRIRAQTPEEFGKYEQQIQAKVGELRKSVDGIIEELERKGYDIETRQEAINKGTFVGPYLKRLNDTWNPVRDLGSIILGSLAAAATLHNRNKSRRLRAYRKAFDSAVETNNSNVDAYNSLVESKSKV